MKNRQQLVFPLLWLTVLSLVVCGCSTEPEIDAETVVTEHFAALGSKDIDKAILATSREIGMACPGIPSARQ